MILHLPQLIPFRWKWLFRQATCYHQITKKIWQKTGQLFFTTSNEKLFIAVASKERKNFLLALLHFWSCVFLILSKKVQLNWLREHGCTPQTQLNWIPEEKPHTHQSNHHYHYQKRSWLISNVRKIAERSLAGVPFYKIFKLNFTRNNFQDTLRQSKSGFKSPIKSGWSKINYYNHCLDCFYFRNYLTIVCSTFIHTNNYSQTLHLRFF